MKAALKRRKSQGRKGNSGSSSGSDPAVPAAGFQPVEKEGTNPVYGLFRYLF